MRLVNLDGRLQVSTPGGLVDVAGASRGCLSCDPQEIYDRWAEFVAWHEENNSGLTPTDAGDIDLPRLGAPSPRPRQVFAVGLNYADHAAEAGVARPEAPVIFTKFASAISGPVTTVPLPAGSVDWEVELVVVIGRGGRDIPPLVPGTPSPGCPSGRICPNAAGRCPDRYRSSAWRSRIAVSRRSVRLW